MRRRDPRDAPEAAAVAVGLVARAASPAAASRTRPAAAPRRRRAATSDSTVSPGAKQVPATNTAVPAPTASSAGTGDSRPTRRSGKARASLARADPAASLRPMPTRALAARQAGAAAPPRCRCRHAAAARRATTPGWSCSTTTCSRRIDAACAAGDGPLALFADLDVDLWALLLTQEYSALSEHPRRAAGACPSRRCRSAGTGRRACRSRVQSAAFYRLLRDRYAQAGARPLADSRVLDFGCGWGRLTRFLARDVPPEPAARLRSRSSRSSTCAATTACRRRWPAATSSPSGCRSTSRSTWRSRSPCSRTSPRPRTSAAWPRCTPGCAPAAILVVTIRPPAYLHESPLMAAVRDRAGRPVRLRAARGRPLPPAVRGRREMNYGETVITLPYVRERWARWFELLHVDLLLERPPPGRADAAAAR